MSISAENQKIILELARKTLENKLQSKDYNLKDYSNPVLLEKMGVFVTLNKAGKLRGCMGRMSPDLSIFSGIQKMALTSALEDPRFPALSSAELEDVHIEVSLLTVPKKLSGKNTLEKINKVRPNIDGVIIKNKHRSATFLPQVWEQLPDKESFFSQLCLKAGLRKDHWKIDKLEIQTYQAEHFEESN